MNSADLWISVIVGVLMFVVYVMEYVRTEGAIFNKPKVALVPVVDRRMLYAARVSASERADNYFSRH